MSEVTLIDGQKYKITWRDSFKWTNLVVFILLFTWAYALIVTWPLRLLYGRYNISIELINAGAIGYALLNTIIAIKNWKVVRKAFLEEAAKNIKAIIISILLVNLVVIVYSLIGWISGGYIGNVAMFWMPIFIALWDSEMLSREIWYLSVFGWTLFILIAIIKLSKLHSITEYSAVTYGVGPIASLILFLLRNHVH